MASEFDRKSVKGQITDIQESDPELEAALKDAGKLQLELAKENNRHVEITQKNDKGMLGQFFGNQSYAASFASIITLLFGLCAFIYFATNDQSSYADRTLALASAALGYLFGKSTSN